MSNNDKLLLTQGVATIKCQVIVKATNTLPEIVLSEENSVKDWTYTDERYVPKQGFIGQFVARTLSGNLQNISDDFNIEGREIELRIGVVSGTSTNWYSLGNFIITDPTDNNVVDNTKFEAMDYTKLFNKKFNGDFKDNVFTQSYNEIINNKSTVTAIWLAKYCCAQVGVEFGQTAFTNSDFIINQNPFLAGETCRDVLKEISKLAYSWVRIGWDNKCYIDFEPVSSNTVSTENTITNNHYYTLETRKELYGPINNVVVGMSGIDGESHSEKDPNAKPSDGEHTIYIYDNPLTNTFELRALAQKKASKLFGLQFAQVSTETIGHPWLQANEKINVKNMENVDNYTYPFNRTIKFTGHIRTTIDSMADSEVEATLAYESEIMKSIKKASATVDKQNGVISLLVEDVKATQEAVENIDGTINPVGVGDGEYVYIEDASENELMYLQIEGKSEQETRSGKNLLCLDGFATQTVNGITATNNNDGTITFNGTSTATTFFNFNYVAKYYISVATGDVISIGVNKVLPDGMYASLRPVDTNDNAIIIYNGESQKVNKVAQFTNNAFMFVGMPSGVKLENFTICPMVVKANALGEYEPYGAMPSPDYPSEIKSVGYANLFDPNKIVPLALGSNMIVEHSSYKGYYIPCNEGDVFSLSRNNTTNNRFRVVFTAEEPADGVAIFGGTENKTTYDTSLKIENIVAPENAKYIFVYLTNNSGELPSEIQLEKSSIAHSYIPYGKYGVEVKTIGKNLLNYVDKLKSSGLGLTNKLNEDGSITTTGIPTSDYANIITSYDITDILEDGETYIYSMGTPSNKLYIQIVMTNIHDGTRIYEDNHGTTYRSKKFTVDKSNYTYLLKIITAKITNWGTESLTITNTYQLEKGDKLTEFEKYQTRTSVIVLNAPLRSLPSGVKDIAYIRNGKLYVDRYVGSVVLDGSENWKSVTSVAEGTIRFYCDKTGVYNNSINPPSKKVYMKSNRFVGTDWFSMYQDDTTSKNLISNYNDKTYSTNSRIVIRIETIYASNVEEFKTWLSTHDTQVDYQLATPLTEEYELTEKPSTFKGVNNIFTNNNPQPKIYVEYVIDNAISKYVEQHVSELRITENEIKTSVSSLEGIVVSSNSETQSALQEIGKNFDKYVPQSSFVTLEKNVKQLQTDTYTKTEINTKLVDGSVTKVMTTSGTFDEDGMHYAKTNAPTSSTINERGVEVDSTTTGQELLFAGYDNDLKQTIVRTENLTVRKYFVVGNNSRIENYGNGGGIFII